MPSAVGAAPTTQAAHGPAPPVAEDPQKDVFVTPQAAAQIPIDGAITEEKVEYRDEDGNLLDEEQVKALEGKVSFSTRYETRTRLVDEAGNEVHDGIVEGHDGAPPAKPEGVDPQTIAGDAYEGEPNTAPAGNVADADLAKERSIAEAKATAEAESAAEVKTDGAKAEL